MYEKEKHIRKLNETIQHKKLICTCEKLRAAAALLEGTMGYSGVCLFVYVVGLVWGFF